LRRMRPAHTGTQSPPSHIPKAEGINMDQLMHAACGDGCMAAYSVWAVALICGLLCASLRHCDGDES
jgi:hypothetical protein